MKERKESKEREGQGGSVHITSLHNIQRGRGGSINRCKPTIKNGILSPPRATQETISPPKSNYKKTFPNKAFNGTLFLSQHFKGREQENWKRGTDLLGMRRRALGQGTFK